VPKYQHEIYPSSKRPYIDMDVGFSEEEKDQYSLEDSEDGENITVSGSLSKIKKKIKK
jgi:hypothetical protein